MRVTSCIIIIHCASSFIMPLPEMCSAGLWAALLTCMLESFSMHPGYLGHCKRETFIGSDDIGAVRFKNIRRFISPSQLKTDTAQEVVGLVNVGNAQPELNCSFTEWWWGSDFFPAAHASAPCAQIICPLICLSVLTFGLHTEQMRWQSCCNLLHLGQQVGK